MGAIPSSITRDDPLTRFTVSIAPTSRAKCKACKLPIEKGALRVSREMPSNMTGDKGSMTHHYHFDHGMHAATRVRCDATHTSPPSFHVDASLNTAQERRSNAAGQAALKAWHKRCS